MTETRIFGPADLPRSVRAQAEALWRWFESPGDRQALPDAVAACREGGLDPRLLERRGKAVEMLSAGTSFADGAALNAFAEDWCGAHARLLAGLVGLSGSWQQDLAADLARGFFLTGTVVHARRHRDSGWCLFPLDDLDRFGVDPRRLEGTGMEKVLWKQAVRARDALASGRSVVRDLPLVPSWKARRYWFGALELLARAERMKWDVWSAEPTIGPTGRLRITLLATVGKTAFRKS